MTKTSQITSNCLRIWFIRPTIPSAALISLCLIGPQRCNHGFLCSCHTCNTPHPTSSLVGKSSPHLASSPLARIAAFQPVFNLIGFYFPDSPGIFSNKPIISSHESLTLLLWWSLPQTAPVCSVPECNFSVNLQSPCPPGCEYMWLVDCYFICSVFVVHLTILYYLEWGIPPLPTRWMGCS